MYGTVSARLNEAAAPTFYPTAEIIRALNEAQRLFTLLTLCLERTAPWTVGSSAPFWRMLPIFADWIAPLRIGNAAGAKIRPARLSELWSLNSGWPAVGGAPERYAQMGSDLLALYPQSAVTLQVQYAGSPVVLAADGDIPEIDAEFHEVLPKYAIYRLRMVEGGEPFAASLPLFAEFMAVATEYAKYVKARNVGAGYDTLPPELSGFDMSRLIPKMKRSK